MKILKHRLLNYFQLIIIMKLHLQIHYKSLVLLVLNLMDQKLQPVIIHILNQIQSEHNLIL